jgi:dTDP-4-dehydrorhamnose reductase
MKILLFGGSGQLGREVALRARQLNFEIVTPVQNEVDVVDRDQVLFLADKVAPDLIINSAAYTAVDDAETHEETAHSINATGAQYVADAANNSGARLIHLSTDYVFDGELKRPLTETDATNPQSVYGRTKLAGEQLVLESCVSSSAIVRTSSLHGKFGDNFIHTMLKLFVERDVVQVVQDQIMSPTWAGWLAGILLDLGRTEGAFGVRDDVPPIYHASCAGEISWFEFATAALEYARAGLSRKHEKEILVSVEPTTMDKFVRPAPRPAYSAFDCSKLARTVGRDPLDWQSGLKRHLKDLELYSDGEKES